MLIAPAFKLAFQAVLECSRPAAAGIVALRQLFDELPQGQCVSEKFAQCGVAERSLVVGFQVALYIFDAFLRRHFFPPSLPVQSGQRGSRFGAIAPSMLRVPQTKRPCVAMLLIRVAEGIGADYRFILSSDSFIRHDDRWVLRTHLATAILCRRGGDEGRR